MTVSVRGRAGVRAYMARLPEDLTRVLRGAARAGGNVIADEAKMTTPSDEVRDAIVVRSKVEGDVATATVDVKPGWARSVATWLEYGTSPHFISVDDSQSGGRGILRINQQVGEAKGDGSLVVGGKFVGKTVWHPGSRPHPFLRPARDRTEAESIAAAQAYIDKRVSRGRIVVNDEGD